MLPPEHVARKDIEKENKKERKSKGRERTTSWNTPKGPLYSSRKSVITEEVVRAIGVGKSSVFRKPECASLL